MPASPPPALPAAAVVACLVFAFLWGANVGSFLNVVAYRLPLGMSVVRPRSRCPACRTQIRALDNVPILSWLLLGRRCRGCKSGISARYPAVEAFSGLVAVHVAYHYVIASGDWGRVQSWLVALTVFTLAAALLAASLIDAERRILPDAITKPGMWAGPAVAAVFPQIVFGAAGAPPSWAVWVPAEAPLPLQAALFSVSGIVIGAGVIWSIGRIARLVLGQEGMGFGDVKLLGMLGGFMGPLDAVITLVVASFLGSIVGGPLLLVARRQKIPFGPYLALAGYLQILYGDRLIEAYLSLVLPRG